MPQASSWGTTHGRREQETQAGFVGGAVLLWKQRWGRQGAGEGIEGDKSFPNV